MTKIIGRRNIVEVGRDYTLKIADRYERVRPKRLWVERFALQKADEYGICVPKIISSGILVDGREYLKLQTIEGEKASSKNLSVSLFEVYKNLGKQFGNMPLDFKRFGWIDPRTMQGSYVSWERFLVDFIKKYGLRLWKKGILEKSDTSLILKHIKKMVNPIKKSCLVHRDLKPQNLIYTPKKKKVFVLDWENVILGDPFFDLAVLWSRSGDSMIYRGYLKGFLDRALNKEERSMIDLYSLIISVGELNFNQINNLSLSEAKKLRKQLKNLTSTGKL